MCILHPKILNIHSRRGVSGDFLDALVTNRIKKGVSKMSQKFFSSNLNSFQLNASLFIISPSKLQVQLLSCSFFVSSCCRKDEPPIKTLSGGKSNNREVEF